MTIYDMLMLCVCDTEKPPLSFVLVFLSARNRDIVEPIEMVTFRDLWLVHFILYILLRAMFPCTLSCFVTCCIFIPSFAFIFI
jgi:hypothetical protein